MRAATEETPELLTNGSITTTSLMRLAHHIKLMAMTMESDALRLSNARTVSHKRDVGPKKEPKFMELKNTEMLLVKKT
jgi:hypothetical protein